MIDKRNKNSVIEPKSLGELSDDKMMIAGKDNIDYKILVIKKLEASSYYAEQEVDADLEEFGKNRKKTR